MGFLAFGGPLAAMSAFRRDLAESRGWLSTEAFDRAMALIKALPGPSATQLALFVATRRAGRLGGFVAGLCLIAPSFFMMIGIGMFLTTIEQLAWSRWLLFGVQAAALGVIAESVHRLARPQLKTVVFWIVALIAAALTAWRPQLEPLVIVCAGLFGAFALHRPKPAPAHALAPLAMMSLKAGAFTFGSGLAIVPLLAFDVVDKHHWLTHRQFLDAVAFGQVTPGPVVITATFIGYKVDGLAGAVVATVGVFAPAFFNMLTWFPAVERRLGVSPRVRDFVACSVAAVVGSIVVALARIAVAFPEAGPWWLAAGIAASATACAAGTGLPVWAIIPGGGVVSMLLWKFID